MIITIDYIYKAAPPNGPLKLLMHTGSPLGLYFIHDFFLRSSWKQLICEFKINCEPRNVFQSLRIVSKSKPVGPNRSIRDLGANRQFLTCKYKRTKSVIHRYRQRNSCAKNVNGISINPLHEATWLKLFIDATCQQECYSYEIVIQYNVKRALNTEPAVCNCNKTHIERSKCNNESESPRFVVFCKIKLMQMSARSLLNFKPECRAKHFYQNSIST